MIGRLLSFWEDLFSVAMLVSGKYTYRLIVNLNSSPPNSCCFRDPKLLFCKFSYAIPWVVGRSFTLPPERGPHKHPPVCPHIALFGLTIGP